MKNKLHHIVLISILLLVPLASFTQEINMNQLTDVEGILEQGKINEEKFPTLIDEDEITDGEEANLQRLRNQLLLERNQEFFEREETERRLKPKNFDLKAELKSLDAPLRNFGYELFLQSPTTFAPATDIPIPPDYVIGPGDNIKFFLYGARSRQFTIQVTREGDIYFPDVGPISVAGLSFTQMKEFVTEVVANQMIGYKVAISLGALRSMKIFVLGQVYQPGSYTVSSLSTLINAIFATGGITMNGSLRSIQLKRKGDTIVNYDLYDVLLNGDNSDDRRLLPGDVIFVPPITKAVGISGSVRRPNIYEIKDHETIEDLIKYAGGLKPNAQISSVEIERVDSTNDGYTLNVVDLSLDSKQKIDLINGDIIHVYPVLNQMQNVVLVSGYAQRPGFYGWKEGLRITDIIKSPQSLLRYTDNNYVLVNRRDRNTGEFMTLQLDLNQIFNARNSEANFPLKAQDELIFFSTKLLEEKQELDTEDLEDDLQDGRKSNKSKTTTLSSMQMDMSAAMEDEENVNIPIADLLEDNEVMVVKDDFIKKILVDEWPAYQKQGFVQAVTDNQLLEDEVDLIISQFAGNRLELVQPILEAMQQQATAENHPKIVEIVGNVYFPGRYPFTQEMTLGGLLKAGGGMKFSSVTDDIELLRRVRSKEDNYFTKTSIKLTDASAENTRIYPGDILTVKNISNLIPRATILGEVLFPGIYPILEGETLTQLIERSGGLKKGVNMSAAIFQRELLKNTEIQRFEKLQADLKRKIVLTSTQVSQVGSEVSDDLFPILNLIEEEIDEDSDSLGRLVINLEKLIEGVDKDISLIDGDKLTIPKAPQSISVVGEVFVPSAHLHDKEFSVSDYISLSGGPTSFGDEDSLYVIKADGSISSSANSSRFFRPNSVNDLLEPGDTIVVPLKLAQFSALQATTEITQILYQMGLAAAAINSL